MKYRIWVVIAVSLFGIGFILGLVKPSGIATVISQDVAYLEEFAEVLFSLPRYLIAIVIFMKNALALVISFVLSPILCLVPILALTTNGWLIAFISAAVVQEESLGFVLAGLLPHGIFELPALIMAQAAALSFGVMVMLAPFKKERRNRLLPTLKRDLKYFLLAIILLLPAAIIETYITPLLLT